MKTANPLISELTSQQVELAKAKELELLQTKLEIVDGLPHIYAWKWYAWAHKIFTSFNREIFCTAANQISKSSTAIRKNIEWACNKDIWLQAWPHLPPGQCPSPFWYFYPSQKVATVEFEEKWIPQFLPRNSMKSHDLYGWEDFYEKGQISHIKFNSGVTIYFRSYEQDVSNLQTGTIYHTTLDEECPISLLPEIQARLNASDGYLLSVFTATLGQLYWRQTMEPESEDEERHKEALKLQVSLLECKTYIDGSFSHWTDEKIKRAIARCGSEAEVQRRIHGKFVKDEGQRFFGFTRKLNIAQPHPLPAHWLIYTGVDPGSGGSKGHPTGIVFLAVSPDFKQGRVFRAWRGDKVQTSSQDSLNKYRELRGKLRPVMQIYDYAAKDFQIVASRQGEAFSPANKERDAGIGLMNVLFKHGMLKIQSGDPELEKLVSEICSLTTESDKRNRHTIDDLSDALRYAVAAVPWNFSDIMHAGDLVEQSEADVLSEEPSPPPKSSTDLRREWYEGRGVYQSDEVEDELDFWNDMAGS